MSKKQHREYDGFRVFGFDDSPEQFVADYYEGLSLRQEYIEKYKWLWDGVYDEQHHFIDAHTHGVAEHFGHPDLQITLPVAPSLIQGIFNATMDRISAGDRFSEGDIADRILSEPYKVKFVRVTESGREVLRLIIPDAAGHLERDLMELAYARQYVGLV